MVDDSLERDEEDRTLDDPLEPATGPPTEALVFYVLGAVSLLFGIVYFAWTARSDTGIEYAGGAALIGAAGFSFFFGTFLWRSVRRVQRDVLAAEQAADAGATDPAVVLYLPESSIWPFVIAVGISLTLAGVSLGFWVLLPGVALLVHGLVGFMHQSRDRT